MSPKDTSFGAILLLTPLLAPTIDLIADFDVADDADLAGEGDVIAQAGAAGDAGLGDDDAVLPDDHVVGDLDEIVDFRALLNPCPAKAGAVDGGIRADFHVVVDLDDAGLRDFDVAAAGELEAEAIAAEHDAAVDDDAVPDHAARADGDARGELAVRADPRPRGRCSRARR